MQALRLKNTRDIGALIRRRRKDLGFDQSELAERNGVSRAWLVKVERGHPNAQIGLVLRLLNYLDVPLSASLDNAPADNRGKDIFGGGLCKDD
jgi:HTH-type transcriptional regulator/antitoxin HipB